MTRPSPPYVAKCPLCGAESERRSLLSTSSFGSPDLDLRPPPMQRSTMAYWIHQCPDCGFAGSDEGTPSDAVRECVRSAAYQAQRTGTRFPALANAFLCRSMIESTAEKHAAAAWSSIYAAWVLDDRDDRDGATECRRRALYLRAIGLESGVRLADDEETDILVAADLLRRTGEHDAVRALASAHVDTFETENVRLLLRFQDALAARGDTGCYRLSDALEP